MMSESGRFKQGTCPECRNRRILYLVKRRRLCANCADWLFPGLRAPSRQELQTAERMGIAVTSEQSAAELTQMIDRFKDIRYYVYDVWEAMTGLRPRESHLPGRVIREITQQILYRTELGPQIEEIQQRRYDLMSEASQADQDEFGATPKPFAEYKEPIPRDDTFRSVASMLQQEAREYLPVGSLSMRHRMPGTEEGPSRAKKLRWITRVIRTLFGEG